MQRTPQNPGAGFAPLEAETRPTVDTAHAAYYLNRSPQTLRAWACLETGPLRPIRINGRLAWPVSGLLRLVHGDDIPSAPRKPRGVIAGGAA